MPSYRVYDIDEDGQEKLLKEFKKKDDLLAAYPAIGEEEDSYALRLHGQPKLKALIGPMCEPGSKTIVRYETPKAFVRLSEEWGKQIKPGKDG